ncbi:MAG: F0F1 ATP synthase subunit B [Candidatus Pacebacteria bacterium]|jgi:F-type H+-transporting ATPase subunit b|nr:F0F1 ATP synthase subunit B [Candidatus Paceibacterota bacterium]MBT3511704.1 F0F1 ATP synthase subunit B [Candidatus Paceibacterota bacterium]MBT4005133.1 F0F1 ATP synthase subunit B [Candidatus Paceibacterota bacterium]MBT4358590.1 F0F1 ATP synthase subunit B [Candidatus Paceibacterota bacterium]MBT4680730.1 F0F1 ATP synthase subunit B [Candidatus Paceibacterota bacterium]
MQIHWYQLLFQIINFGVLIFVLNKFLYGPIVKIIDQRNKKIQDGIKAAEKSMEEKASLGEFKKKIQLKAEKEATEILNKARKQANEQSKQMVVESKEEAQTVVQKEFDNLKEKLKDEEAKMKNRIGNLVVDMTTKVLEESLSVTAQHKVIDRELKALEKTKVK